MCPREGLLLGGLHRGAAQRAGRAGHGALRRLGGLHVARGEGARRASRGARWRPFGARDPSGEALAVMRS